MIQIPAHIITSYTAFIAQSDVLSEQHRYFIKWLRSNFDSCRKYTFGQKVPESLAAFMDKLKEKRQAESLRKQARHAVSLFFEMDQYSAEKVQNDIAPLKNIVFAQASNDATYLHTKESLPNQAVSPVHAPNVSKCPSRNGLFAQSLRYAQNFILEISTICLR